MLFSLFVGVIAFSLLYVWLVMHRTRGMAMEDYLDDRGLDEALAARRAESRPRRRPRREDDVMEDAGFIIGSYVLTFAAVGVAGVALRAARVARSRSVYRTRRNTGSDRAE